MTDESWAPAVSQSGSPRHLLRAPGLPILVLAAIAMVQRQYLPDILLVAGAAGLIVVDAPRWRGRARSAEPTGKEAHPWQVAGLAALAAGALAVLPRESHELDLGFALVGLLALRLTWLPHSQPTTTEAVYETEPAPPARWWWWALLGVTGALVELFSFLHDTPLGSTTPATRRSVTLSSRGWRAGRCADWCCGCGCSEAGGCGVE